MCYFHKQKYCIYRTFATHKLNMTDKIQMVDLRKQYLHIKGEIDQAIQQVIDTTAFINGPAVNEFARNLETYLNVKHVIPCANGTDALQIAMMALGLKAGDEVIVPSFTYIATVEVLALLQLTPIFCEVEKDTFNIDISKIESLITPNTKAIVPVHLYGQAANMEPLLAIATKHNLFVMEDTAQAIGGKYTFSNGSTKMNGTMGTIGTTSFFPSKNLGCYGDGGAIFTNDDALAGVLKIVANHGQKIKYHHEVVGCNSRLDTIQAAILNVKLPYLDTYCNNRRAAAAFYNNAFADNKNLITPTVPNYSHHVYHQYTLVLQDVDRDTVAKKLEEHGIPSMVYYPIPAHKQKMFAALNLAETNLETTDWLTSRVISLPIHTEMTNVELEYIATTLLKIINELK
jgi:UDP-2-acetamido-2-deoxy-ribo-hexuluronate aminotransferase